MPLVAQILGRLKALGFYFKGPPNSLNGAFVQQAPLEKVSHLYSVKGAPFLPFPQER